MNISNKTNIRRVIIVHGWADDPRQGWIAWLCTKLRAEGIDAVAPTMPDPQKPHIEAWLDTLRETIGEIDEGTALVGHSLGVYVLLRYLNSCRQGEKLGKLILVAGFAGHERTAQGKRALPEVEFDHIKKFVSSIYCVYSDDDKVVPPEWSEQLGIALGAQNVVDGGKGHFAGLRGCDTLESVYELI